MTQRQFDDAISRMLEQQLERARARLQRLQQAKAGARDVHRIWIKKHLVPEHDVRGHWRLQPGRLRSERSTGRGAQDTVH